MTTEERTILYKQTVRMKDSPSRQVLLGNMFTWPIWAYSEAHKEECVTLSAAHKNYELLEKICLWYNDNFPQDDFYWCTRNPVQFTEAMGNKQYQFDDENFRITVLDQSYMGHDDYEAIIENPRKAFWEALPRKYTSLQDENNSGVLTSGLTQLLGYFGYYGKSAGYLTDYKKAKFVPNEWIQIPIEVLINYTTGMRQLGIDLRRCPEKIEAVCNSIATLYPYSLSDEEGSSQTTVFDEGISYLGTALLNFKQFEKFVWPYFKEVCTWAENKDKLVCAYTEGNIARYHDYIKDLPYGRIEFYVEVGDIFENRKLMPNITIKGGMPYEYLSYHTKDECIDMAKKITDEVGGSGFVFSPSKMMSFPSDGQPENVKAVFEYVSNVRF